MAVKYCNKIVVNSEAVNILRKIGVHLVEYPDCPNS